MSLRIETLPNFERELKQLKKKYPSVLQDLGSLLTDLMKNPTQGTSLGNNCYKIRLAIRSKGQGKSGGARVITCVASIKDSITLLSIYDKSAQDTIADEQLRKLSQQAEREL